MKKIFLSILAIAAIAPITVHAQQPDRILEESVTPVEGSFFKFEYQGFSMMIPANNEVEMSAKEAVVKSPDGTFGMSVKVEKDKSASANTAVEMCRRMVNELDVKGAKVSRVIIHGMQGGKLEGITEGIPVTVLILNAGGKYFKMVIINTPDHADWVNITADSVTEL
ncbi:MAG: hypothetical protein NC402_04430 [Prevotella sp.]|nr:hypothetical protein [Prevotella sp.]MCM1075069.1 hypothetical protein [Ruminococcus sp.]